MTELVSFIRVVHIFAAILMAWPYYALVAVNQRIKLGPPLGDRTDTYVENIIKNRTIPCFVFQGTVLVSGLALMYLRGQSLSMLYTNLAIGLKFFLLFLMAGLLTYVHISLQPRIDSLFAQLTTQSGPEEKALIGDLRGRRKRLASICMFSAFTSAMLGMQVWVKFPIWLTLLLVLAIGLFTWRAYSSETPYGWV